MFRHNYPEFLNQWLEVAEGFLFLFLDVVCFKRHEKMLGISSTESKDNEQSSRQRFFECI